QRFAAERRLSCAFSPMTKTLPMGRELPLPAMTDGSVVTFTGFMNVLPPSIEAAKYRSYLLWSATSRVSSHEMPIAPRLLTAMLGWICHVAAGTSPATGIGVLHVSPRSV